MEFLLKKIIFDLDKKIVVHGNEKMVFFSALAINYYDQKLSKCTVSAHKMLPPLI